MAGEESEAAVRREILEETGLDVVGAAGGYQFTYRRENSEKRDNYFVDVYRYEMDVKESQVRLQEAETQGFLFASRAEIEALAAQGIFLHYDSIRQVFE